MQDHDARECVGGVLGGGAVVAGAEAVEEWDGRVADVRFCAGVSAGAGGLLVVLLHVVCVGWVGWGGRWIGGIGEVMEGVVKRFWERRWDGNVP